MDENTGFDWWGLANVAPSLISAGLSITDATGLTNTKSTSSNASTNTNDAALALALANANAKQTTDIATYLPWIFGGVIIIFLAIYLIKR